MKDHEKLLSPIWLYPKHMPAWEESIVKEFNIPPPIAQVLVSRGFSAFEEIYNYLYAKLPNLHSPEKLLGMEEALERIERAFMHKESLLIYGDNDVDGITGTALLVEFFSLIGIRTYYYIPNRTSTNATMITDALQHALENHCKLLITVDCGITAAEEIEKIIHHKIDVIISDHHEPTDKIPNCIATLNPKLLNSEYPNRDLTGVGVAFKLAHGVTNKLVERGKMSGAQIDLKRFLDLVALGTVADMGALTDENRILVRYGLRQFAKTKRVGLLKLLEICEVQPGEVSTTDIVSKIAPRFNSSGRIAENPEKGVELLLAKDPHTAAVLAREIDQDNTQRQLIEKNDMEDIAQLLSVKSDFLKQQAIVLYSSALHPGIIPIISTRIAKHYNRPTLILAINNGIGKGSMRTIPEFPLLSFLRKQAHLLINFGGHDYAAGLTIKEENIPQLEQAFLDQTDQNLSPHDTTLKLQIDAQLQFKDLTFDFLESLQLLEPYGMKNPPPIFYTDVKQAWLPKLIGKSHLKLYFDQKGRVLEGIGFGLAHYKSHLNKKNLPLKIAFTPHVNTFLNKSSIQLLIKDLKTHLTQKGGNTL